MWESAVDPARVNITEGQPTFTVGAVSGRVQSYIAVDTTSAQGDIGTECADTISLGEANNAAGTATGRCVFVQIAFDVADEMPDDGQASITPAAYVGPDSIQVEAVRSTGGFAYGGTANNTMLFEFANTDPGGVLRLDVDGGEVATIKLDIPAEFLPLNLG